MGSTLFNSGVSTTTGGGQATTTLTADTTQPPAGGVQVNAYSGLAAASVSLSIPTSGAGEPFI
ncbi:MAG: hypothetical protein ACE5E5_16655, partial [Phycisphaerae bacterium]